MKDENVKKCFFCKARLVKKHIIPICDKCKRKGQNAVATFAVPVGLGIIKLLTGKGPGPKKL